MAGSHVNENTLYVNRVFFFTLFVTYFLQVSFQGYVSGKIFIKFASYKINVICFFVVVVVLVAIVTDYGN